MKRNRPGELSSTLITGGSELSVAMEGHQMTASMSQTCTCMQDAASLCKLGLRLGNLSYPFAGWLSGSTAPSPSIHSENSTFKALRCSDSDRMSEGSAQKQNRCATTLLTG
jgi:hypothetical protein